MSYINEQNLTEFDKNIKKYIDNKLLLDKERFAYGIEWDITVSDPHCTRIGNPELHRTLPLQSSMKGCLLADDGTVNEYLPEDDWSNSVLDGSKGQVMVELPDMYVKFESEGNKRRAWMSAMPLVGFHLWKKCYVSAYEASLQRSTNKLCSVCNSDPDYRGGDNTAEWDDTYRSLLGRPVGKLIHEEFRIYARNRGSINWNMYTYQIYKQIFWLYVVEYANFDSQENVNNTLTSEGFKQGGLGIGCTNLGNLVSYNKNQGCLKIGLSNNLGNYSGSVEYQMPKELYNKITYIARYRGIEHIFGHLGKYLDGILPIGYKIYTCNNPKYFSSRSIEHYTYIGSCNQKNPDDYAVYPLTLLFGEQGDIIIKENTNNARNTKFKDASWLGNDNTAARSLDVSGSFAYESDSGILTLNFLPYPDFRGSESTRLCYIP